MTTESIEPWHTANAPFGFTDHEKSAWSVGCREGYAQSILADLADRAAVDAEEWMDISSAPKDGTEMLLSNGAVVAEGHWLHAEGGITEHRDVDGRYISQDESDGYDGWIDWSGGMLPEPTHWRPLPAAPGPASPTPAAGSVVEHEPLACFGLSVEQLDALRTNGLKPDEIAGGPDVQLDRVRELVWWFARLANGHANPKWLRGHAFELAYYVACMDVKQHIDLTPIRSAAFFEGAQISASDRDVLVRIGKLKPVEASPAPHVGDVGGDAARLDWLRENSCDLRCFDVHTGEGDGDIDWRVIEHHMGKPHEREIGRAYSDDPRAAIDAARAAQQGAEHASG